MEYTIEPLFRGARVMRVQVIETSANHCYTVLDFTADADVAEQRAEQAIRFLLDELSAGTDLDTARMALLAEDV
jgi:hypothetical protein